MYFVFRRRDKEQFKKSKGKPWSRGTHSPLHTPSHEQSSAYADQANLKEAVRRYWAGGVG